MRKNKSKIGYKIGPITFGPIRRFNMLGNRYGPGWVIAARVITIRGHLGPFPALLRRGGYDGMIRPRRPVESISDGHKLSVIKYKKGE